MYVCVCLVVLTLVFIRQLYKRVGQIATPVETHDLRLHISGLVFIQLLDAAYQEGTIRRCLNVDVVCKKRVALLKNNYGWNIKCYRGRIIAVPIWLQSFIIKAKMKQTHPFQQTAQVNPYLHTPHTHKRTNIHTCLHINECRVQILEMSQNEVTRDCANLTTLRVNE